MSKAVLWGKTVQCRARIARSVRFHSDQKRRCRRHRQELAYHPPATRAGRRRTRRPTCYVTEGRKRGGGSDATAWRSIQAAAERHNDPGTFTTFIGYEYTSSRNGNLHRNVFYRGSEAPPLPFSRLDSLNPEDLWAWMDEHRGKGIDAIAIPHNANGSNGNMFDLVKFAGEPLDAAYAEQRMRNEPLVEITQIKGTSDTHPFLSPNDEWADSRSSPIRSPAGARAVHRAATCARLG